MRNYELTLVFSGVLKPEELSQALEAIITFVQGKGGILLSQEVRGKRALLAPIKAQKEGNLANLSFTMDPSHMAELEKQLKEDQKILRFLCAVAVSRKTKEKTPHLTPSLGSLPPMPREHTEEATRGIDLGEIDKKLEEIFKQP